MSIILHVGAGKCGSSSLQTHLSSKPLLQADNGSALYEYVCITPSGDLLRHDAVEREARLVPPEAQTSCGAEHPWASDEAALKRLSSQFSAILVAGRTPIASRESWLNQSKIFADHQILARLGLRAKVVVFVRPQIPWLNSGWWQWGAWTSRTLRDWVEVSKQNILWARLIGEWQSVPGVESVEVHPASGDVVSTFFRSIGISIAGSKRRNTSLDGALLNHLRRRGDLRSEHGSGVEFILEKHLATSSKGTPWVLEQNQIADLIAFFRADNEALLSLVSSEARQEMERDPMWWDPAAYSQCNAVSADITEPTIEALEDISRRAIDAVIRLDIRVRALEAIQYRLTIEAETARRDLALAAEAAKPRPMARRLRKAISINGIRRLVGA
jgi:hypothetical protein